MINSEFERLSQRFGRFVEEAGDHACPLYDHLSRQITERHLANKDGHGRWLEWL